jgi:hypothetical protein
MSTILKALRRLEHEKAKVDRPLREQVAGADGDDGGSASSRRWPILVGGVLAGVAAGLAVLFAMRHEAAGPAPSGSAPPAAEAAAPRGGRGQLAPIKPKREPAVAAARPPAPAPAPAEVEDVAVVPRQPARPRLAAGDSVLPREDEALEAEAPVPEAVAAAPIPVPAARPPAPTPVPARTPMPAVPAGGAEQPAQGGGAPRAAAPPVAAQSAPAPTAGAVVAKPAAAPRPPVAAVTPAQKLAPAVAKAATPSAAAKRPTAPDAFPELRVERTLWHPLPDRRMAVIEVPGLGPQEFHEGAEVVAGARIALIEPSGVVFRFEGKDVRRKIGEGP